MNTHVLSPDDLRLAAEAFDEALQSLPEQACEMKPYTARQLLARYIMEKTLDGQRDLVRLREGALSFLALQAVRQTA
jgi:hypothetical protein